jgi:hypothetical protein
MPKLSTNKEDKSIPLAIIRGGKQEGEIVYFDEKNREGVLKIDNLFDYVPDKEIREQKKYMTTKEMLFLKDAFEKGYIKDEIKDIYDKIKPNVEKQVSKHIKIHDGTFEIIPMIKENQVQKCFISGMSGSGKSTWIANYARNYKKLFNNNPIYVFSRHDEDAVIDSIKGVKRIKLNEEILEADIDIKDLKNSLIIMDDIDTISNKEISKLVAKLRDDLLENARHYNIYLCCVAHQILNYKSTRHLILESDIIVFFPRSGGYQIKRFLKEYMSLDRKQIDTLLKLPSRWVAINKNTYPNCFISENDIYIL